MNGWYLLPVVLVGALFIVIGSVTVPVHGKGAGPVLVVKDTYPRTNVFVLYDFDGDGKPEIITSSYVLDGLSVIRSPYGIISHAYVTDWNGDGTPDLVTVTPDGYVKVYTGTVEIAEYHVQTGCGEVLFSPGSVYVCGDVVFVGGRFRAPLTSGVLVTVSGLGPVFVYLEPGSIHLVSMTGNASVRVSVEKILSGFYDQGSRNIILLGVSSNGLATIVKVPLSVIKEGYGRVSYYSFLVTPVGDKVFVVGERFIVNTPTGVFVIDPIRMMDYMLSSGRAVSVHGSIVVTIIGNHLSFIDSSTGSTIETYPVPEGLSPGKIIDAYPLSDNTIIISGTDSLYVAQVYLPPEILVTVPSRVYVLQKFSIYHSPGYNVKVTTDEGYVYGSDGIVFHTTGEHTLTVTAYTRYWSESFNYTVNVEKIPITMNIRIIGPLRILSNNTIIIDIRPSINTYVNDTITCTNGYVSRTIDMKPGKTVIKLPLEIPFTTSDEYRVKIVCTGTNYYGEATEEYTITLRPIVPSLVVDNLGNGTYIVKAVYAKHLIPGRLMINGYEYPNPAEITFIPYRIVFEPGTPIAKPVVWTNTKEKPPKTNTTTLPFFVETKTVYVNKSIVLTVTKTKPITRTIVKHSNTGTILGLIIGIGIGFVLSSIKIPSRTRARRSSDLEEYFG